MYSKKDFDNLIFNPLCQEPILTKYPKLYEIVKDEFLKDTENDIDKLIRYVILVYDSKSILVTQEKDMNYRKGLAADLVELNEDEVYRENVFYFKNKAALELTTRFLVRFVRSREFAALCAVEFKFWESIKKLITPIEESSANAELQAVQKKATISEEIDKDLARLDKYYKAFFGDDSDLLNVIKEERWTPEKFGKKKIDNV